MHIILKMLNKESSTEHVTIILWFPAWIKRLIGCIYWWYTLTPACLQAILHSIATIYAISNPIFNYVYAFWALVYSWESWHALAPCNSIVWQIRLLTAWLCGWLGLCLTLETWWIKSIEEVWIYLINSVIAWFIGCPRGLRGGPHNAEGDIFSINFIELNGESKWTFPSDDEWQRKVEISHRISRLRSVPSLRMEILGVGKIFTFSTLPGNYQTIWEYFLYTQITCTYFRCLTIFEQITKNFGFFILTFRNISIDDGTELS